jgi:polar amino acid transport system substrate-binding protein
MQEAFQRVGGTVEIHVTPVERSLINVNAGLDDGSLFHATGAESEYPNLIRVPEKILDTDFVAFVKRPDIRIRNWNDLKPYSVAYPGNWKIYELHVRDVAEITKTHTTNELVPLLEKGRVDVILLSRRLGWYLKYQTKFGLTVQEPPLISQPGYLYLNKKHAALVPKLAQVLRNMKADGSYRRIYNATLKPFEGP